MGTDETGEHQLANAIRELRSSLDDWAEITNRVITTQEGQVKKNKYLSYFTFVTSSVALATALAVGGLHQRTSDVADRLDEINRRTSNEVTCPIYDRFLDGYNVDSPAARADPEGYELATKAIESGAEIYGCAHTKRGLG